MESRINLLDLLTPGIKLDVLKASPSSYLLWYNLCIESRHVLFDAIRYNDVKLYKVLPSWKREYYPELDETDIAAHLMQSAELVEVLSDIDVSIDKELFSIIKQYRPKTLQIIQQYNPNMREMLQDYDPNVLKIEEQIELKIENLKKPNVSDSMYINDYIHYPQNPFPNQTLQKAPNNRYNLTNLNKYYLASDLFPDSVVPVSLAKILSPYDLKTVQHYQLGKGNKFFPSDKFEKELVEDNNFYESSSIFAKKLVEYFANNGYEYYYFGVYKADNAALMSRNRQLPFVFSGREKGRKLLPNSVNFEQGSGGPNMNFDLKIWEYMVTKNYTYVLNLYFNDIYGYVLTWGADLLAQIIEQMLGRLPTWIDIGIDNPNTLPFLRITDQGVVRGKNRYYCSTYARIILGAYDYWDWNDIKKRRYYRLLYLQWVANRIYLFRKPLVESLDYDDLVNLIKTRAIARRKMPRPTTFGRTMEFFNISPLEVRLQKQKFQIRDPLYRFI